MFWAEGMPALKGLGNLSAIFRVAVMVVEEGSESGCSGPAYGSYSAPINIGSGGGDASGGGAVILNVTNNLTLNGSISAQGTSSDNSGSGGSIFLTVSSLLGSGSLNASGGEATPTVAAQADVLQ